MKTRIFLLVLGISILSIMTAPIVFASTKTSVPAAKKDKKDKGEVSRELVFDGTSVNGRYHSAGEAVAQVESEKTMNQLIGARRDFRDRLSAERERLEKNEKK